MVLVVAAHRSHDPGDLDELTVVPAGDQLVHRHCSRARKRSAPGDGQLVGRDDRREFSRAGFAGNLDDVARPAGGQRMFQSSREHEDAGRVVLEEEHGPGGIVDRDDAPNSYRMRGGGLARRQRLNRRGRRQQAARLLRRASRFRDRFEIARRSQHDSRDRAARGIGRRHHAAKPYVGADQRSPVQRRRLPHLRFTLHAAARHREQQPAVSHRRRLHAGRQLDARPRQRPARHRVRRDDGDVRKRAGARRYHRGFAQERSGGSRRQTTLERHTPAGDDRKARGVGPDGKGAIPLGDERHPSIDVDVRHDAGDPHSRTSGQTASLDLRQHFDDAWGLAGASIRRRRASARAEGNDDRTGADTHPPATEPAERGPQVGVRENHVRFHLLLDRRSGGRSAIGKGDAMTESCFRGKPGARRRPTARQRTRGAHTVPQRGAGVS